jgi:YVTN family beta-propeller protein
VPPFEATVTSLKVTVPVDAISGEVRVACGPDTSNAMFFTVLVPSTSPVDEVIATVGTGSSTKSVAVTPDGALAYSVSPEGDVVVPIDVEGQTSYSSISVGDNPVAIAIDPAGTYAYVCNFGSGTVSVIVVDPDSATFNTVVQTIAVGTNPIDVDVNPDGSRIYVANAGSSDVSVIDGDDASATWHQVVATVETGSSAKSVAVTPDGARIYVGTDEGYVVIDAQSNAAVATVETGSSTKSVAITPDGALLVVLTTSGTIYIYDVQPGSASENEVVATVETGTTVKSVVVTPDGAMLYIIFEDSDEAVAYALTVTGSVGVIEPGTYIPPPVVELTPVHTVPTGKDPACIAFDPSGSGWAMICNAGDNTVTILNATGLPPGPIPADILVTPRTLNLKSEGRWVTGRIELPVGYAPEEIDISTVLLQDTIPVAPGADVCFGDEDEDGLRELVVKFDRALFQSVLPQGEYVPVTIAGTARNRAFIGEDTIRTIRPGVVHPCGEAITMGRPTAIVWTSPSGSHVDSVSIDGTLDDGVDWFPIARRIPDLHSFTWQVPAVVADRCRVLITLWAKGEILGQGMSQDVFMIGAPLAVTLESFSGAFENEAAVLRWRTLVEENIEGFNVVRSESETGGFAPVNAGPVSPSGTAGGASYEVKDAGVSLNRTYYYKLEAVSRGQTRDLAGPYKVVCRAPFSLAQNAPNPFNPSTSIKFTIAEDAHVTLAVYDVGGRRVRTLVDRDLKASFYRVDWDGRNESGRSAASGIYFYRLQAGSFVQSRKMILLR